MIEEEGEWKETVILNYGCQKYIYLYMSILLFVSYIVYISGGPCDLYIIYILYVSMIYNIYTHYIYNCYILYINNIIYYTICIHHINWYTHIYIANFTKIYGLYDPIARALRKPWRSQCKGSPRILELR